jgi:transposase
VESSHLTSNKKKAQQQQRELAYQDEAGVCLLPSVGASYAPCGERPVILADSKNKLKVSLSVVITPQADLYYEVRQGTFNGAAIVRFLKKMKHHLKKKLTLIWDGASIHSGQSVKDFLQEQPTEKRKVWLEKLPAYSPELNPAEQVWHYLKNVLLKNQVSKTLAELKEKVRAAMEIIKKDKELIKSFFRHPKTGFYANPLA